MYFAEAVLEGARSGNNSELERQETVEKTRGLDESSGYQTEVDFNTKVKSFLSLSPTHEVKQCILSRLKATIS